jgi:hypothetical protein
MGAITSTTTIMRRSDATAGKQGMNRGGSDFGETHNKDRAGLAQHHW